MSARVGCVSCDQAPVIVDGVRVPCAFCTGTANLPAWFKGGTPTQRKRAFAGRHPLNGLPLLFPDGDDQTCGSCAHIRVKERAGRWLKCALMDNTGGPGTDTRAKWPACERWAPAADEGSAA